jgi:catechol 2,3-dioxygenase-like lactoylglutathione lyase family enzyme
MSAPGTTADAGAAGKLPRHLALVTLGVADVATSRAFYEALGLEAAGFESADIAFFDMNGTVLALFGREALAADAGVPADGCGFRAVSCAFNVASEAAVDEAIAYAEACGARVVKQPERVFWGGYSGYFADPDGHLWEVAYNPVTPRDADGRLIVPPPKPA